MEAWRQKERAAKKKKAAAVFFDRICVGGSVYYFAGAFREQ